MKICGLLSEYNPFHNGHLYQIEETRKALGEDCAIVCCMSGDFVQRGQPALADKRIRAAAAVACGADLVLSLPLRYSLSSAQGFADGAVHILHMAGAGYLSFGCEDELSVLSEVAQLISERELIKGTVYMMEKGMSFAAARERQLYGMIKEKAFVISKPNNILAIEYIRAINQQNTGMEPLGILRKGAGHDSPEARDGIASASAIREMARSGIENAREYMPRPAFEIYEKAESEGRLLNNFSRFDCAACAVLGAMTEKAFKDLPDISEGIENRLMSAVSKGRSLEEICTLTKSKRYALSRIRRLAMCAFLGIKRKEKALPSFTRVLAFNEKGRKVLSQLKEREDFFFITKPALAKRLPKEVYEEYLLEAKAADVFDMALDGYMSLQKGREWTKGPLYFPENGALPLDKL